jgi:hypothetical protein
METEMRSTDYKITLDEIFERGRAAYAARKMKEDNPYDVYKHEDEFDAWYSGYESAREEDND